MKIFKFTVTTLFLILSFSNCSDSEDKEKNLLAELTRFEKEELNANGVNFKIWKEDENTYIKLLQEDEDLAFTDNLEALEASLEYIELADDYLQTQSDFRSSQNIEIALKHDVLKQNADYIEMAIQRLEDSPKSQEQGSESEVVTSINSCPTGFSNITEEINNLFTATFPGFATDVYEDRNFIEGEELYELASKCEQFIEAYGQERFHCKEYNQNTNSYLFDKSERGWTFCNHFSDVMRESRTTQEVAPLSPIELKVEYTGTRPELKINASTL